MNIIIAGGGKMGITLARQLSAEQHNITMIDASRQVLNLGVERLDLYTVQGNCASMPVLLQAGVQEADLLIAVTNADEVNLLCCTTAHGLNPKLHTIARIRNPEYTDQIHKMQDIFALSMAINPEKQAATEIERLLKYPGFLRRDTFAKGRTEIVELRIDAGSKLCNASLSELPGIVKCKVLVCAVLRGGTAIAPGGAFTLREGDRIFVTAPTQTLTVLLKNLGILPKRARKVFLCGGGKISYYLASQLAKSGISVQLIESNHAKCVNLAETLPEACIIHGDATDQALLESEGIADCDALITLTGTDELNMIISLYGASRNIPQIITKLGHLESRSLIDSLALGSIVNPRELCCNTIIRYVRAMQNQTGAALSIHTIADGQVEAVEFRVEEDMPNCNIPLKQLKLQPNVLVAGITRGGHSQLPNGDSVFQPGDTVVVVTSGRGVLHQLGDIFA